MKSKLSKTEKRRRARVAKMKADHAEQIKEWQIRVKWLEDEKNDRRKSFYTYCDQLAHIRSELVREGMMLKLTALAGTKDQPVHVNAGNKVWQELIKGFKLSTHRHIDIRAVTSQRESLKVIRHELRGMAEQLTEGFIIQVLQLLPELGEGIPEGSLRS